MTFDEQSDPYDPEVAERFALLDRLVPPPVPLAGGEPMVARTETGSPRPSTVEVLPASPSSPGRRRRPALLAAAAAVVVLVGVGAMALTGGDDGPGPGLVEAGPAADGVGTDGTDGATDRSVGSTAAIDDDGTAGGDGQADGSSSEAITVEVPGDPEEDGDTAATESSSTTTIAPSSTATTSASTTASTDATDGDHDGGGDPSDGGAPVIPKETTVPERPTGSIVDRGDGQLITISGIVTEVFRDCQSWMVLNEDGVAEPRSGVSCDGGSFIVVDGRRIQTSSGYVAAEMTFDKHPAELQPGTFVVVIAVNGPYGGPTLDCDRCGVGR